MRFYLQRFVKVLWNVADIYPPPPPPRAKVSRFIYRWRSVDFIELSTFPAIYPAKAASAGIGASIGESESSWSKSIVAVSWPSERTKPQTRSPLICPVIRLWKPDSLVSKLPKAAGTAANMPVIRGSSWLLVRLRTRPLNPITFRKGPSLLRGRFINARLFNEPSRKRGNLRPMARPLQGALLQVIVQWNFRKGYNIRDPRSEFQSSILH